MEEDIRLKHNSWDEMNFIENKTSTLLMIVLIETKAELYMFTLIIIIIVICIRCFLNHSSVEESLYTILLT